MWPIRPLKQYRLAHTRAAQSLASGLEQAAQSTVAAVARKIAQNVAAAARIVVAVQHIAAAAAQQVVLAAAAAAAQQVVVAVAAAAQQVVLAAVAVPPDQPTGCQAGFAPARSPWSQLLQVRRSPSPLPQGQVPWLAPLKLAPFAHSSAQS